MSAAFEWANEAERPTMQNTWLRRLMTGIAALVTEIGRIPEYTERANRLHRQMRRELRTSSPSAPSERTRAE